jgi:Domain of unknown function (DUF4340)
MKKSTLIVLALALIAGAAFYFFDWKPNGKDGDKKAAADKTKSAFTFQPDDVTAITIAHPGDPGAQPIRLARRNADWQITQPLTALADNATAAGIAQALSNAHIEDSEPGTPDRLKQYGLDPAAVVIDFELGNGAKHTVQLGKKDFVGTSVYSKIDSNKDVSLLPESLLGLTGKSLDEYRDHGVLHAHTDQITSLNLKNASGEIALAKDGQTWKFSKPQVALADSSAVDELLAALTGGRFVNVAAETADDLAKYGLATPIISFSAADAKGKSSALSIGKKDGDMFFAREESLPEIFRITADLQKKLSETFADLRDKKVAHFDPATITHIDFQNANGPISLTRKNDDEWTFDAPADVKGKSASAEKILASLEAARAEEVLDTPPAAISAKLAKPAFQSTFTFKGGKKLSVAISAAAGDFVYIRTSDSATIYKVKKAILDDLNLKPSDMTL